MIRSVLVKSLLTYAVIVLAICLPIFAVIRLIGMAIYKIITFFFYIILLPSNFNVSEWRWGQMSWEDFYYEVEFISLMDVLDYYESMFRKYILREKPEKKKPIQLEV